MRNEGFVLSFKKGKSYQYGESFIGVLSNLPRLKFNPAKIFSLYLASGFNSQKI
jgi:hypothetical protein